MAKSGEMLLRISYKNVQNKMDAYRNEIQNFVSFLKNVVNIQMFASACRWRKGKLVNQQILTKRKKRGHQIHLKNLAMNTEIQRSKSRQCQNTTVKNKIFHC